MKKLKTKKLLEFVGVNFGTKEVIKILGRIVFIKNIVEMKESKNY